MSARRRCSRVTYQDWNRKEKQGWVMAKETRCILCGGKLLPSGKCAACGWDNSGKETKYRLNAHNENTVHLHADNCEDNLNRDNDGSPVRLNLNREKTQDTQKKRIAGVQNADNQKQSVSSGAGGSQTQKSAQAQRGSQTQNSSHTQTVKKSSSWASVNLNREKRKAQTTRKRAIRKQAARSEETTKQFSSADAAKKSAVKPKTANAVPAGTAKENKMNTKSARPGGKLRRVIVILVALLFLLNALGELLDEFFPGFLTEMSDMIGERIENAAIDGWNDDDWADDDREDSGSGKPELQQWDETADGYLTTELTQGNYFVGYDIPAGEYQLECLEGSAYATWESLEEEGGAYGFVILYSEEKQKDYNTYWGEEEECPWYQLSPVFELSEGMVLNLDHASFGLLLTGVGEGIDSLKDHEPQAATESIYLSDDVTMTAGEDFEAGVYDICIVVDGDTYAWVDVEKEDGSSDGISFSTYENMEEYLRYILEDGDTVTVTTYGTDAEIMLAPSW